MEPITKLQNLEDRMVEQIRKVFLLEREEVNTKTGRDDIIKERKHFRVLYSNSYSDFYLSDELF
jgi:hypothetical protein